MKRIAIVGGGISGLATAFYIEKLSRENNCADRFEIQLFEASDRIGGKIFTRKADGLTLEMGAESFLARKPWGIQLCRDLEIVDRLASTRSDTKKTFIWNDNHMHRLPEGLSGFVPASLGSLRSTTLLSLAGKLRIAMDLVLPAKRGDDDESVASFISRRIGRQAWERIAEPLLCGIYCANGDELSLDATFPRLRQLEKQHGSLIRGLKKQKQAAEANTNTSATDSSPKFVSPFATFGDGMSTLPESVASRLTQTELHFQRAVTALSKQGHTWSVQFANGDPAEFDEVVLALPAFHSSRLLEQSDSALAGYLAKIRHASTALVNIWYDARQLQHSMDGYGFVIPTKHQQVMTAVTWTSSKHANRAPDGLRLLRAYLGKSGSDITEKESDQELFEIAMQQLQRTMGIRSTPVDYCIQRWPQGSPQYTMQHPELMSVIDECVKKQAGLHLCGASYRGVGIPDCIHSAMQAAGKIVDVTN